MWIITGGSFCPRRCANSASVITQLGNTNFEFIAVAFKDAPAGDLAVCNRTLRVFDGKQRFDLALSPKRTEKLGAGAPDGLPDTATVCRVAYKPIGGYRRETYAVQFLQESDGIEAWLVPVEGTGIYVPYKVIVPTTWGDGARSHGSRRPC